MIAIFIYLILIYLIPATLFVCVGISHRDLDEIIFGLLWPVGFIMYYFS